MLSDCVNNVNIPFSRFANDQMIISSNEDSLQMTFYELHQIDLVLHLPSLTEWRDCELSREERGFDGRLVQFLVSPAEEIVKCLAVNVICKPAALIQRSPRDGRSVSRPGQINQQVERDVELGHRRETGVGSAGFLESDSKVDPTFNSRDSS